MNKFIMIWEAETCKHLYKFTGHKGPVSVRPLPFSLGLIRSAAPLHAWNILSPAGSLVQEGDSRPLQCVSRPLGQSVERRRERLRGNAVSFYDCSVFQTDVTDAGSQCCLCVASATRTPSQAWTAWAASAVWRREGGTVRWGCGRSPRSLSWCSTATSESPLLFFFCASSQPCCFIIKYI